MTADEILAETRAFNLQLQQLIAAMPKVHEVPPEVTRRARREGRGVLPAPVFLDQARTITIPGPVGELPLRVIEAPEPRGAHLHIHGGGWTIGAADMQDTHLWELAQATGLTVLSVDYRLAPEHPYPAGPDDCEAAALWLLEHHDGRLTIGGDSAGAHLAVVALLRSATGTASPRACLPPPTSSSAPST